MTQSIEELEQQAAACSRRGDLQAVERICRDILRADGKHLSSLRFLADIALQAGDFPEAELRLRSLVGESPGDLRALSQLAQAMYRQGKRRQALEVYLALWRANPRERMIYLTIGCLYLELGETDKAAQVFSLGESRDGELLRLWQRADTS
ncbi:MAG: tetratricopeptide repeat protein, partial [Halieaceae bacterium]|nr:tetratricopeptide repeat protein [Halieaceae bacterium]